MNSPKILSNGGLTLNLATIKCFKMQTNLDLGKTNILVVEHKKRYDYIQHPQTGKFEKQEYNETTQIEYRDFETASAYCDEWAEIWQEYLDNQE